MWHLALCWGLGTESRVMAGPQPGRGAHSYRHPTTPQDRRAQFQRELQTRQGQSFWKRHCGEGREIRTFCMEVAGGQNN